jgi:hypothetical protein
MKYEVINISTSTERYIANGILTHNKTAGTNACPGGTTYDSRGKIATFDFKPQIYYQISYVPSTPIVITFANDTSVANNYFIVTDTGRICTGDNTTPMTKLTFTPTSISTATQMTPKSPTSLGWLTNTNVHITASLSTLRDVKSAGNFYWSAAMTAKDNSNRSAANNWSTLTSAYASVRTGFVFDSCLTPDTIIQKYDGNTLFLNDIEVGDNLMSIDPETNQYESSIVTSKTYHTVDELYLINNGLLRCSKSHKHIIKRNENWIVITSDELLVGDIVLTKDCKELRINNIDTLK